jgi:hypothetical protein
MRNERLTFIVSLFELSDANMAKKLNRFNTLTQIVCLNAQICIYSTNLINNFAKPRLSVSLYEKDIHPYPGFGRLRLRQGKLA